MKKKLVWLNIIKVVILEMKRGYIGWNNFYFKYKYGIIIVLIDEFVIL